jgi:Asp-tRNA(Asn)/Glu-tRNA(Gln) amidotransferase A subunit family amidase
MPEPMTITDAARFIRRGELSPSELLEQCLARVDRYEDRVKAWVYLDRAGAREQAERLTAELKSGQNRGPLHGIPIGIKDIIDVFDMPTGCGSKLWANSYARRDATVVERLRQAGAIIMGKTVTTAFAFFDPPVTRNPWNLERTPGGSSSGSAAAVACGMCLGALASQTGGSITRPASYCGVYGIKPTYGRVSVDGVLQLAPNMDHVGAMANCVRDLAILFQTISGPDGRPGFTFPDHTPIPGALSTIDRKATDTTDSDLCVLGGLFDERLDSDVRPLYSELHGRLESQVSLLDRKDPPAGFLDVLKHHRIVMAVEAAHFHGDRLRHRPEDYLPRIQELIEEGLRYPSVAYRTALTRRQELGDQVTRILNGQRYFLTPATIDPPPDASTTGDPAFNSPWSFTGHPTLSLPYAFAPTGLPLAVQIVGSPMCEEDLFAAAAWLERAIGFERRPLPL